MERREKSITRRDYERLTLMLDSLYLESCAATELRRRLEKFTIVETSAVPAGVVTMNAHLTVRPVQSQSQGEPSMAVSLVFPHAVRSGADISILTPLGLELLGAREGDVVAWRDPAGRDFVAIIGTVVFQPDS